MDVTKVNEVYTVAEVAELLRISRTTVYELVHADEIPHKYVAGAIRFPAVALRQWAGLAPSNADQVGGTR